MILSTEPRNGTQNLWFISQITLFNLKLNKRYILITRIDWFILGQKKIDFHFRKHISAFFFLFIHLARTSAVRSRKLPKRIFCTSRNPWSPTRQWRCVLRACYEAAVLRSPSGLTLGAAVWSLPAICNFPLSQTNHYWNSSRRKYQLLWRSIQYAWTLPWNDSH